MSLAMLAGWVFVVAASTEAPVQSPTNPAFDAIAVVARGDWDTRLSTSRAFRPAGVTRYRTADLKRVLDAIVVHHSDFDRPVGPLGILDYHLDVSGFADIGYHFVIARDGTVYEGRAIDLVGAHAGQSVEANRGVQRARKLASGVRGAIDAARQLDPDYGAVGVVLDGSFRHRTPPPVQRRALDALVTALQKKYDIAVGEIVAHREVRRQRVEARFLTFTGPPSACPGDAGFRWFTRWKALLLRREELANAREPKPGRTSVGGTHIGNASVPNAHSAEVPTSSRWRFRR